MNTIFCVYMEHLDGTPEIIDCWRFRHEAEERLAELEKRQEMARSLLEEHSITIQPFTYWKRAEYWDNLIKSKPEYRQYPDYGLLTDYDHYYIVTVPYHGI